MADDRPFLVSDVPIQTVVQAARARDNGEDAVIGTDAAGRIVYWNDQAARLYGWSVDEVLGRNVLDVMPTRRSGDAAAEIMEEMRAGSEWAGDFIVRRRDGSPMRAIVDNSVVSLGDVVVGFVGVSRPSMANTPERGNSARPPSVD
jgi:PAS domain S-box-containing protein